MPKDSSKDNTKKDNNNKSGGKDNKGKSDPGRDALHKRLHTLQNVADPSGLKEAIRVLDLCNTDPLMLRIMEERVQGWENDVVEALPAEEREKFTKESRKAMRGSDDDDDDDDAATASGTGTHSQSRSGYDGDSRSRRTGDDYDDERSQMTGSRYDDEYDDDYNTQDSRSHRGGGGGGGPRGRPRHPESEYSDSQYSRGGGGRPRGGGRYDDYGDSRSRGGDGSQYDDDQYSEYSRGGGGGRGGANRYSQDRDSDFYQPRGAPGGRRGGGGGGDRGYSESMYSDRTGDSYYSDERDRRGGGGRRHGGGGGGRRGGSVYSDQTGDSFYSEDGYNDDRRRHHGGGRHHRNHRSSPGGDRHRSRDMPPPGPNEFRPVDRHLYENARQRLIDFYSMVNPERVKDVDKILEAYNGEEETMFRHLHLKYVSNLRKRLDPEQKAHEEELLERAKKLGTELPPPPPPEEIKLEGLSVNDLLNRGNDLMKSAPEPPIVNRSSNNNNNQNNQIPIISNDSEVVPALEQLHVLTESNLSLAQEVAIAEQSVLQSRFRVILSKCLKSFNNSPNHLLVINDIHAGIEFQVALSDAVWAFLKEAVLETPLIHSNSVRVTVSASHAGGTTTQVDRNILASALREWSAQSPHTVAQRKAGGGRWSFSTSRTAWWVWPSTPSMRDAIPGKSLIYPTVHREQHKATNLNDASFPSLRDLISARATHYNSPSQKHDGTITSPNAALYDPSRQNPGYWDHFAHQMNVLQSTPELSGVDQALRK